MMYQHIFCSSKHACYINANMIVETLVFSVNKRLPKNRIYIFILNGSTILVKKFSDKFAVSAVYFRSLRGGGVFYL